LRPASARSSAAQRGRIQFEDLSFERGHHAWAAYGQSKLAMQLFVLELQRRLTASGSGVKAIAAHPGWTRTDLQRTAGFARLVNPIVAMRPEQGVLSIVRAAVDPDAHGGTYYGPDGMMQMRGFPTTIPFLPQALKADDQARLWEASEQLTGTKFPIA
jgi:NAD(P)-dependent dehydrogenase (short-subunit alcohol dehydrogenase family)